MRTQSVLLTISLLLVNQPVLWAGRSFCQEQAVAGLKKLGARVEVDEDRPDQPVIKVTLTGTDIVDADSVAPICLPCSWASA